MGSAASANKKDDKDKKKQSRGSTRFFSSAPSKPAGHVKLMTTNPEDLLDMLMPVYYISEPLTNEDLDIAFLSWQFILQNNIPKAFNLKDGKELLEKSYNSRSGSMSSQSSKGGQSRTGATAKTGDTGPTAVMTFYELFYSRLFDVHPLAKMLFKRGLKSQGKFLVRMITLALTPIEEVDKFEKIFSKLAETHSEMGVKAVECKELYLHPVVFIF